MRIQVTFEDFARDVAERFQGHFATNDKEEEEAIHECAHHRLPTGGVRYIRQGHDDNDDDKRKRDDATTPRSYGGLRVLFDTRFVNDERACREVGQEASDEAAGALKCAYEDVLTPSKADFLLGVLQQAQKFLSTSLYAERFERALTLQGETDEQSPLCETPLFVPPEYVGSGLLDADLVVFVTTWPARRNVRGYAQPCLFDMISGRPIAGYIDRKSVV